MSEATVQRRYRPYPAYRDSGVECLGEVPVGWEVRRMKFVASITEGLVDPTTEVESERILVAPNHIQGGTGKIVAFETAADQGAISGKYTVRRGQLIYSKIRPALNKVAIAEGDWLCSADMYPLTPQADVTTGFLHYWMLSSPFVRLAVDESMRVAMPKINRETLGEIKALIPPLPAQRAIAGFLDHETSKIDTLITKKERLLELLDEQRAAVISHAVTKGLDPDAPMKDSAVEWLGEVPERWEVVRLGFRVDTVGGATPATDEPSYWGGSIPWISPKDMKATELSESEDHVTEVAVRETGLRVLPPGAVLVVTRGMILLRTVPVALTRSATTINQDMKALISHSGLSPLHLSWILQGQQKQLGSLVEIAGHGTRRLTTEKLLRIRLPLPPLPEQQAIAAYLDRETHKIDTLKSKIQRAIDLLKEYRTALISAAVTGKIDVRDEVAA